MITDGLAAVLTEKWPRSKRMSIEQDVRRPWSRDSVLRTVISTIENLVQDWDIDEPTKPTTRVVADLHFESIDLIQMIVALEKAFSVASMSLVDLLIVDGRYLDDLTIAEITEGVFVRITSPTPGR